MSHEEQAPKAGAGPLEAVVLPSRDQPLKVAIENEQIVIRIGIGTLCFCAKNDPRDWDAWQSGKIKIVDEDVFAGEVVRQLKHEEEDGTTPVHILFDEVTQAAVDDGAEGLEFDG